MSMVSTDMSKRVGFHIKEVKECYRRKDQGAAYLLEANMVTCIKDYKTLHVFSPITTRVAYNYALAMYQTWSDENEKDYELDGRIKNLYKELREIKYLN